MPMNTETELIQALHAARQHYELGQLDESQQICQEILTKDPSHAEALHLSGLISAGRGDLDNAVKLFSSAIASSPHSAVLHLDLGAALYEMRRYEEAIQRFEKAISIEPKNHIVLNNLGNALRDLGHLSDAIENYDKALDINSAGPVLNNRGIAFVRQGELDKAADDFRRAIELAPDDAQAHFNESCLLLLRGDFETGWKKFEWRKKAFKGFSAALKQFKKPFWQGNDLAGKTILIYAEQGFGDAIQFSRYIPQIAQKGGRVLFAVPAELRRLFSYFPGMSQLLLSGDKMPEHDYQTPLLSLPHIFDTSFETIPCEVPYLRADPFLVEKWQTRFDQDDVRIGLIWHGRPSHTNDQNRSIPVENFRPLLEIPKLKFYSLQVGDHAHDLAKLDPHSIVDLSEHLTDFAETAAAISHLDLVISVDTAPVHLAGALGRPVWTLLPFIPDWRWLLERNDSPWYPSMRLFRQPALGDWEKVIARVSKELKTFSC